MKRAVKKKRKKNMANNQLGMIAIAAVVLVLLGFLVIESNSMERQLAVYAAEAAALEEAIEDEYARTEEIEEMKEYMKTDDYAEEVAREKLGLVKDNEIVFEEEK